MSLSKLPLSPHLQVYRLPLVALVSISSRICFVANGFAYALFIIFLISIASGSEIYTISNTIFTSTIGKVLTVFGYFHCTCICPMKFDTFLGFWLWF